MDDDIRQLLQDQMFKEAFELILGRYRDKVFRLAYSMLRNESQAEDLAQDILVRIWKGLPTYQGGAALSTWIYAISRNTCLTELKRRSQRPTVSLQAPDMEEGMDRIVALQTRDRETGVEMDVNELLDQLPEKYRQVITLFYLEQKAYEEVAVLLGLPLGTVKTFLFRARKELLKLASRRPLAAALA